VSINTHDPRVKRKTTVVQVKLEQDEDEDEEVEVEFEFGATVMLQTEEALLIYATMSTGNVMTLTLLHSTVDDVERGSSIVIKSSTGECVTVSVGKIVSTSPCNIPKAIEQYNLFLRRGLQYAFDFKIVHFENKGKESKYLSKALKETPHGCEALAIFCKTNRELITNVSTNSLWDPFISGCNRSGQRNFLHVAKWGKFQTLHQLLSKHIKVRVVKDDETQNELFYGKIKENEEGKKYLHLTRNNKKHPSLFEHLMSRREEKADEEFSQYLIDLIHTGSPGSDDSRSFLFAVGSFATTREQISVLWNSYAASIGHHKKKPLEIMMAYYGLYYKVVRVPQGSKLSPMNLTQMEAEIKKIVSGGGETQTEQ